MACPGNRPTSFEREQRHPPLPGRSGGLSSAGMAFVATRQYPETGQYEIMAAGRLSKLHGTNDAEFSMLISDRYQHRGLGTALLQQLVQVGRDEALDRITADILVDNTAMQRVCEKLGFTLSRTNEPSIVQASLTLRVN